MIRYFSSLPGVRSLAFILPLMLSPLAGSRLALSESLPASIKWLTNDTDPEYADTGAKRGGTFNAFISSFPMTLRANGPDSNDLFAGYTRPLNLSLIDAHPNTENIIPQLATHWAYGDDGKTMYFKINPKAVWSDNKPVTADDFVFTMEFGKSKVIVDPWTNDFWTKELARVFKIDELTIGVESAIKRPLADLHLYTNISPTPKHAFGGKLPTEYVQAYNWTVLPNTAAYEISAVNKGKSVTMKRKKNWFLDDARFYRNRFNVEKIQVDVVRDLNVAWEMFKKGQLPNFSVLNPTFFHDKANDPTFKNGYINKLWFFTDSPQPSTGFWLNERSPPLDDLNVRLGLAHSINIDAAITKMLRSEYEHLNQHYVGYGKYTDNSIKARAFDLKEAEKYFTKAGWGKRGDDGIRVKNDQRLSFTINYSAEIMNSRLAFFKEEAKKAGVELNLQLLDGSASFKQVNEKKFQIAYMVWGTGMRPAFYEHYHSDFAGKPKNNNITNTSDPELDKLIDRQRTSSDEAERVDLAKKIQKVLHERSVFIPSFSLPFYRDAYWRWWRLPKVPGLKVGDSSFDVLGGSTGGLFWMDEGLKTETQAAMKSGKTFPEVVIVDRTYKIRN
jgi:microcin C transport system substrate-binding protein